MTLKNLNFKKKEIVTIVTILKIIKIKKLSLCTS